MFLAGWLLHSIRLAVALGLAVVVMQAPAVTPWVPGRSTAAGTQFRPGNRAAERFYGIAAGEDEGRFLAQLRAVEPSNAETLAAAFDRQRGLRASYEWIEHSPDLLRPIIAAKDVAEDEGGRRRQIAATVFDSFAPHSICPLLPPFTASSACSSARS